MTVTVDDTKLRAIADATENGYYILRNAWKRYNP